MGHLCAAHFRTAGPEGAGVMKHWIQNRRSSAGLRSPVPGHRQWKRLGLLGLAMLGWTMLGAEPFTAIRPGEHFRYRISWGVFSSAGEVSLGAERVIREQRPLIVVRTHLASRGLIRGLYSFDDSAELTIDEASARLLSAVDEGRSGSQRLSSRTFFDYDQRVARHHDEARPERSREIPLPDGTPVDLISALVQTRDWDLPIGGKRDALVYFGRDLFPVTLTAEAKEVVKGPAGKVSAVLLVPRMETEVPRGIFKRGGEIKVWVSETTPRLPVQMQLKLNFGTALLTLVEHTPAP